MLRKCDDFFILLFAFSLLSFNANVSAQDSDQNSAERDEAMYEVIRGSVSPDKITNESLFNQLSLTIINTGPGNCSNSRSDSGEAGFSSAPPCSSIPGVDMERAEMLAREYRSISAQIDFQKQQDFCESQASLSAENISSDELSRSFETMQSAAGVEKSEYFIQRGTQILGREEMDNLLAWASENIRTNITVRRLNIKGLLQRSNVSAGEYVDMFCSSTRN